MQRYTRFAAFTLIELLIVVAIIGILAAIAVPNFLNAQVRAKVARAQSDHDGLRIAIESYRLDRNQPPPSPQMGGLSLYDFAQKFIPLTTPVSYLSSIPSDPFPHRSALELDSTVDHRSTAPGAYAYGYFRADHSGPGGQYNYGIHKWMVSSSGPDGLLQYFAYYPQTLVEGTELCSICKIQTPAVKLMATVYHPSNGVVSAGEIIRWSGH
ncbi:MAG: prepilin-type N-terminal cleavage/methylation domain-containing protein [Candidatus Omnitrophota bacterium]